LPRLYDIPHVLDGTTELSAGDLKKFLKEYENPYNVRQDRQLLTEADKLYLLIEIF
jgi:hypothetical protein